MKLAGSVAFLALSRNTFALHQEQPQEQVAIDAEGRIAQQPKPELQATSVWGIDDPEELEEFSKRVQAAAIGEPMSSQLIEEDTMLSAWFGTSSLSLRFEPPEELTETNSSGSTLQPTNWREYWDRKECKEAREADLSKNYFQWCQSGKPIIYSKEHNFGYMKTPKAASTAIYAYFEQMFPDAKETPVEDLPENAYIFTFVRKPFEQKLAGYAEVSLKQAKYTHYGEQQKTKFQDVPRSEDHGRHRFRTFLEDIENKRFEVDDKRKPTHAASQIAGVLCTYPKVNYIGHLERVGVDWAQIQKEANLPKSMLTKALPIVHEGQGKQYLEDETVPLNDKLDKRLCTMYWSDHACLGYVAFEHCSKYRN